MTAKTSSLLEGFRQLASRVINISLSAAIWGEVPSAMQRATWSAFNFMLALMLILGFSVGSAVGAGQASQVVFVGGALSLAANTVYVVRRAYGCRRLTWG